MTKFPLRFFGLVAFAFIACTLAVGAELPIIAKARAYLGSEAALKAVKSVHYLGVLKSADPADKSQVSIEIIFQAPYRQRIVAKSNKGTEITALDNYDAWQRVQSPSDPTRWNLTLLSPDQIKRLRANTWQNLAFFRGIEREGGKLVDHGDVTIDGVVCRKIEFSHTDKIIFYRYFEAATGRLVLTETEAGGTIREQGEQTIEGVRFPKMIANTTKLAQGGAQTINIAFSKITVNEPFDDQLFAIPSLSTK